jgi:hypothetical protein
VRLQPGLLLTVLAAAVLWGCDARSASDPPRLTLERAIPLADAKGRIDHLAIDPAHRRLFVAELANGSVEAVDLASGRSRGRITGLSEPQGLGYLPGPDELAVATGGDGMLRFYRAGDLAFVGAVKLGEDADDVRVDLATGHVVVGFGAGALAVVDPATRKIVGRAPLSAHPEGFEVEGGRAYVNVPNAGRIEVVDIASGRRLASWRSGWLKFNFPLALDLGTGTVAAVYRLPSTLAIYDVATGVRRQTLAACGDADDVFFDDRRKRIYIVCGSGAVDVLGQTTTGYARLDRIESRAGARTGAYSRQLDRLFVAARATRSAGAAILVYRPS